MSDICDESRILFDDFSHSPDFDFDFDSTLDETIAEGENLLHAEENERYVKIANQNLRLLNEMKKMWMGVTQLKKSVKTLQIEKDELEHRLNDQKCIQQTQ